MIFFYTQGGIKNIFFNHGRLFSNMSNTEAFRNICVLDKEDDYIDWNGDSDDEIPNTDPDMIKCEDGGLDEESFRFAI